jgi:hypothetical protein
MTYTIAVCRVKSPDDRQRNCPKHVEFYAKNKFEKLVHLVGFIIIIYHDARSPERQKVIICIVVRNFRKVRAPPVPHHRPCGVAETSNGSVG